MKDTKAFGPLLQGLGLDEAARLSDRYVPASVQNTFWGVLPSRSDRPVLTIESGESIVIDTVSHEGIMPDQARIQSLISAPTVLIVANCSTIPLLSQHAKHEI